MNEAEEAQDGGRMPKTPNAKNWPKMEQNAIMEKPRYKCGLHVLDCRPWAPKNAPRAAALLSLSLLLVAVLLIEARGPYLLCLQTREVRCLQRLGNPKSGPWRASRCPRRE